MALAVVELIGEKIFTGKLHTLSVFNFFLIAFLGGISLIGNDGIWFKLQPAFTGIGIAGFLIFGVLKRKGLLLEMLEDMGKPTEHVRPAMFARLEKHLAAFFGLYGLWMVGVAIRASTDTWLFFKTIGFYLAFGFFLIFEWWDMRRQVRKYQALGRVP